MIPSTWWETHRWYRGGVYRAGPIIRKIQGLKEKVAPGRDGLHFRAGDSHHLADTLNRAATGLALVASTRATLRPPTTLAESSAGHAALYQSLSLIEPFT